MQISQRPLQQVLLLSLVTGLLSGCNTLPHRYPDTLATTLTVAPDLDQPTQLTAPTHLNRPPHQAARSTALARQFDRVAAQHPQLTGFHVLSDPNDALTARLQLIEHAQHTIDLQYYIWDNDQVGALALEAVLRAADRGVKVRLLIDDNNSASLQSVYRTMATHPNVEVRLFNPYRFRKLRALDILLNFNRITRRMHNKTFTIDQRISLIGGRNMSNQYYNIGDNSQFSDMDVMLVGQAVHDIQNSFDEYWTHPYAYPVQQLVPRQTLTYTSLRQQLGRNWQKSNIQNFLHIVDGQQAFRRWFNQNLKLEWVTAQVVRDSADKIRKDTPRAQNLNFQLDYVMRDPRLYVDLVSAYFVPSASNIQLLSKLIDQGVQVRVLTNSYKANDVAIVHAFYGKHRRDLLNAGVELYEFKPLLPVTLNRKARVELFGDQKFDRKGLGKSSLHAKFMALDNAQVFVGSFNFDPRSVYLNTEIGVVLNSPTFARTIHDSMTRDLLKYAYKVELNPESRMIWRKQEGTKITTTDQEPHMTWWQKIVMRMASWLPIERQM